MKSTIEIVSDTISVKHSFRKCPWLFLEMNKCTEEEGESLARRKQCSFCPCNARGQPASCASCSPRPGSPSRLPHLVAEPPRETTPSWQGQEGHPQYWGGDRRWLRSYTDFDVGVLAGPWAVGFSVPAYHPWFSLDFFSDAIHPSPFHTPFLIIYCYRLS